MQRLFFWLAMLLTPAGLVHAQSPDAAIIQQTMNESLELEFPRYQEFADVQILRGGSTVQGDYLFLCTGRLMWSLSTDDFAAAMQQEIDQRYTPQDGDDLLWRGVLVALSAKLERLGQFQLGDTVAGVRFRVRIEQAGVDWIVTDVKIKESDINPLSRLQGDDP